MAFDNRASPRHPPYSDGPIVLASASPRRREILTRAGVAHEVIPSKIEELERPDESPTQMAMRLAREKALAVATQLPPERGRWVLGADTLVVVDGDILGQPRDADHACGMLIRLTGRRHRVITGVAVVQSVSTRCWQIASESEVVMRAASRAEIRDYVATGEPLDKAGSYGIQGEGGRRFVTAVEGSESNVMGLPIEETLTLLARARADFAAEGNHPDDRRES